MITISTILKYLDEEKIEYEFYGNMEDSIIGFSSITNYKSDTISWIKNNEKFLEIRDRIELIKLVVINKDNELSEKFENVIRVDDTKNTFFSILENFYKEKTEYKIGFNTVIAKSAIIHPNASIGNNCTIEDNVEIGEGTVIYHNVVIKANTKIGKSCLIQSGAVIGEAGFGLRKENDVYVRAPHFGGVEIGDRVEIGANTCIVCGTIDNTVISDDVKIDNLCHIAHNVFIGKNTLIVAETMVGGSVRIGDNCYVSTSIIRNQLNINNNSFIGLGSLVVKDVKENALVYGAPAKEKGENKNV